MFFFTQPVTHRVLHSFPTRRSSDLLHPKVALMNNGAKKGGSPETWQLIHDSPGLQDLWQLHFAIAGGRDHNSADPLDRKSTRLNSSHLGISYAVFCLKKKKIKKSQL